MKQVTSYLERLMQLYYVRMVNALQYLLFPHEILLLVVLLCVKPH